MKPRLGVSACLLGGAVRFDGGHKRNRFLVDVLGAHVEWVPVCPEVEIGLGIPRPAIRLESRGDALALVDPKSGADHTAAMAAFSARRVRELEELGLCGYVLKKSSPSCGMERVKVFASGGMPRPNGRGIYAAALLEVFPNLPVEEEGRLSDPVLRENFIERVFAYQRLRRFFSPRWTVGGLVAFHTAQKMTLLSHSTTSYQRLGQLVAAAGRTAREALRSGYESQFMSTLRIPATTRRHTNVLMHMAGHLKKLLDPESKAELIATIDEYRRGLVPLIVPLTLLRHHIRVHEVTYLSGQTYLEPHPRELMLRNRV